MRIVRSVGSGFTFNQVRNTRAQAPYLRNYRRELSYGRTELANFAARYPKLVRRFVFTDAEPADPLSQHLIESAAFLTAGVHSKLNRLGPRPPRPRGQCSHSNTVWSVRGRIGTEALAVEPGRG
jgi:hypothetical protein